MATNAKSNARKSNQSNKSQETNVPKNDKTQNAPAKSANEESFSPQGIPASTFAANAPGVTKNGKVIRVASPTNPEYWVRMLIEVAKKTGFPKDPDGNLMVPQSTPRGGGSRLSQEERERRRAEKEAEKAKLEKMTEEERLEYMRQKREERKKAREEKKRKEREELIAKLKEEIKAGRL